MKHPLALLVALLANLACTSTRVVDPHVWRATPGQAAESIPGPLKNFGSFDSFSDALKAACPLILSKPNASVGHLLEQNPELALRVSTEYCAWLYYTPEHKYELSMLTDQEEPGDALHGAASCLLPPNVDDPRYTPTSIQYIFLLHNHPFAMEPSERDIHLATAMANAHGLVAQAGNRKVPLAVVAFFSSSRDAQHATCDGFYQYIPATSELLKWHNTENTWRKEKLGEVKWISPTRFIIMRE
ncbi:hypothetical protein [Archangium violaceum]|uniref:Uncharacterized protein n=1 Tax=Archangium violaceum Cb vi76 TaxID=1406225 RepID=A0A084SS45_9BACT|nr:hypothetical protein [Archangium violaceum]KFA91280.1 hypothetical protein Q664_23350 [Archangium violaceum Cb vi76]